MMVTRSELHNVGIVLEEKALTWRWWGEEGRGKKTSDIASNRNRGLYATSFVWYITLLFFSSNSLYNMLIINCGSPAPPLGLEAVKEYQGCNN